MSTNAPADRESIEPRSERALTECMTVLDDAGRAAGADDLFVVVSQSGREYLVDARERTCECPDHQQRAVECKHLRRCAFATGDAVIPGAAVDRAALDEQLGLHVDSVTHVAAQGRTARPDGGDPAARPGDCECWAATDDLPCVRCYVEGFARSAGASIDASAQAQ